MDLLRTLAVAPLWLVCVTGWAYCVAVHAVWAPRELFRW
jgi:hypothetical protein